MAALATIPGREEALEKCLRSLRPQVERLAVVCHDLTSVDEIPSFVRDLADNIHFQPDVSGSIAKLRWSRDWDGLYLACDDDIEYPTDYARTMGGWVKKWGKKALVTCHGRVLTPKSVSFKDVSFSAQAFKDTEGAWINYPGGCALAFHTSLQVPESFPGKSTEEASLAIWAQENRVPIWLVPHKADWLRYVLNREDKKTIWEEERSTGFSRRNAVLASRGSGPGWGLVTI